MPDHVSTPPMAPDYGLYREVTAVDSLPQTNRKRGCACQGIAKVCVQVVPSGGANPSGSILFWSEHAGKFVQGATAVTFAGVGVDTPFEFVVDAHGRTFFVAVTTLSAGKADILVAGAAPA